MTEYFDIHLEITYKCNNKCFYCYNEKNKPFSMSLENSDIFIDKVKEFLYTRSSYLNLIITGGEPFQNFDVLTNVYSKLIDNDLCDISINTNLTTDIDKLKELEKINKNKKISLFVSVPSMLENIYNKITQSNNYSNFINAFNYVANNDKYDVSTNLVINDINVDTLVKTIHLIKLSNINSFRLSTIINDYIDIKKLKTCINAIDMAKKINIDFTGFSSPLYLTTKVKRSLEYQLLREYDITSCGAGNTTFGITPDGFLKLCVSASNDTKFLNIFESEDFIPEIIRSKRYNLNCLKCENTN